MGQAKRRKDAGARVTHCRTCTYCCTLPEILALEKPAYHACRHIEGGGCGIFGAPERPGACLAYECAALAARLSGGPERNKIPHPLDCGAYGHVDARANAFYLFVDPDRAEYWKSTALVDYLAEHLDRGRALFITDRGRQMLIRDKAIFLEILKHDLVSVADAEGRALDVPSFATR